MVAYRTRLAGVFLLGGVSSLSNGRQTKQICTHAPYRVSATVDVVGRVEA
ncbi:hypothetical protein LG201_04070 [Methylobacillus gramineus]|nr:hypothetical protein [Methylobacillus gramineus]MCB5184376.1 hypothetical protein [Methylobacillus gramineus]